MLSVGALGLLCLVVLVPMAWMVLTAFKDRPESMRQPPTILPDAWNLDNFVDVFATVPFATQLVNTVIVTAATVVLTVLIAAMAAFGLEVVRVPGRNAILLGMLMVTMVPGQIFLLPQYQIFVALGMTDTLAALVVPSVFSAIGAFLLAQSFRSFPRELIEAAVIDGAGYGRIFLQIVVPNAKGPLTALAVMSMLASWDDLLWPLVVNRSPDKLTLAPGLTQLQGSYVSNVPLMLAAGTMAMVPMLLLFLVMQRQFTQSFTQSGLK
ncbi:carbohydrate ABC transporter permease [Tessaracoccus sp. OS52]|uniref:carbohydrate ABC transporter permease n=1 Tax=Tessaracoccus sp. OS52 TaxID=2886691 RepID=UPI001D1025EB|nr:carbohydrate ABC transporter permease [Tessaracoccus sp. OS52]